MYNVMVNERIDYGDCEEVAFDIVDFGTEDNFREFIETQFDFPPYLVYNFGGGYYRIQKDDSIDGEDTLTYIDYKPIEQFISYTPDWRPQAYRFYVFKKKL